MEWLQIAQSLGIPVMCLVSLAFAVWKVGVWAALNVLQPLAVKHMDFIDRVGRSVDSQTESMKSLAVSREKELKTTQAMWDRLNHIAERVETAVAAITDVRGVVIKTQSVSVVPGGRGGDGNDPRGR